ncbi:MAG: phenylalanine--tRNA ligase subunit beta [Helicobacteraceae bacterium]|nr:phenylalanine--tRNA ligase subunit beta [Helicobacteraceae bacterium]
MKFSRNLISNFIDISKIDNTMLIKSLNDIGLEVESVLHFSVPKGVVVGKVIERVKHPDADKLSVCKVDIGSDVLQIVCGALNVEKNQFVPVATIGTKLEKITIKKSKLRGVESFGMICSSSEIGFPKIGNGIFVLDSSIGELELGKELSEYKIFNDTLFELGITPNRGDCLSLLGIAMDLAVVFNLNLKTFKEKESKNEITPGIGRILNISSNSNLKSSLYYKVAKIEDLTNSAKLRLSLALCDNLSDDLLQNIINYAVYMTGVLINSYAFNSYMQDDKKITLEIKKDDRGIESVFYEDKLLSNIGIFADEKYSANMDSKFVIFEASFIPANYVSSVIFNNNVKTTPNIAYLSKRGSSPLLKDGITFLCNTLSSISNSMIYSSAQQIMQNYPQNRIDIKFEDINNILGNEIKNEDITSILKKMNFTINSVSDDSFISAIPPLYRQDIQSLQDVAEEILRIKGIDKLDSKSEQFSKYLNIDDNYKLYRFKRNIAQKAMANRFFECMHYVFAKKETLQSYGYEVLEDNLDIKNPITNDLNTLRTSLIPSMLDSVVRNNNYGYESISLFEIGSIYDKFRNEKSSLAFLSYGYKDSPKYPNPKGNFWDFYAFAESVNNIIGDFSLESSSANMIYHKKVCAKIIKNNQVIGLIGKLNPYIANKLDLDKDCFICEISFDSLFCLSLEPKFREFSKYQESSRDFSILIDKNIAFKDIRDTILQNNFKHIKSIIPLDVYKNDEFKDKISLSFRIILQAEDSTLKEEDLKMQDLIDFLSTKFGAELR